HEAAARRWEAALGDARRALFMREGIGAADEGVIASSRQTLARLSRQDLAAWVTRASGQLAPAHGTLRLAEVLLLPQGLALVPFLLAAAETDDDLGVGAQEVHLHRHDGVALLPGPAGELRDLDLVQQELALAPRGVVRPGALHVRRDVGVVHPHLAALDVAVPVDQGGAALPQRLHLGAGQHDAGFPGLIDEVVVTGALVRGDELLRGPVARSGLLRGGLLRRHRDPPVIRRGRCVPGAPGDRTSQLTRRSARAARGFRARRQERGVSEVVGGVDGVAVLVDLEVEVAARRGAGGADIADGGARG